MATRASSRQASSIGSQAPRVPPANCAPLRRLQPPQLPLVALVFSVLNAAMLRVRIARENQALAKVAELPLPVGHIRVE